MADERTTDETSASSDALLVGGSSASPSPTPTFAGTGRPQRRARRFRWQTGIPRSALALSAFSCALLLAGVVNYAFAVPGMLYKPAVTPLNPMSLILAASASDDGGLPVQLALLRRRVQLALWRRRAPKRRRRALPLRLAWGRRLQHFAQRRWSRACLR